MTLGALATLAALTVAPAQDHPADTLRAGVGAERIRLDGVLDEPAWAGADSIAGLTETEPIQGGVPRSRTTIRVLSGPSSLVIGVDARFGSPGEMVSFSRTRDAELDSEDHVRLVLDPFGDGRSGYLFAVNPAGARFDALITDQGEGENREWDAPWEAATRVSELGWSVEIRIPVKSLSFPASTPTWRFNIQRRVQARLETQRWSGARRDWELGQTARAGTLAGLVAFDVGGGLTLRPAITAGGDRSAPGTGLDGTFHPSIDIEQRLSANLNASVTVNTDFAETEVDTRQTNLTRFPLFFPEKRTFFLQGSDLFEFGLGLGSDLIPFFSRRVGLLDGRAAPILAGGKLDGRLGETRVGGLVARTGRLDSLAPGATVGAVRVRRNVLEESSVGALATWGDPTGAGAGWLAGVDAVYRTSRLGGNKNFLVGLSLLAADRPGATGSPMAWSAKVDYPNDVWDLAVTWHRIGDGFDPALGFVPRRGVNRITAGGRVSQRPGRLGVRQTSFSGRLTAVTGLDGQWESYRWRLEPVSLELESGDQVELTVSPEGERLFEPFEVADGVQIRPGTYRFTRYGAEIDFASRRRLAGELAWRWGGFYGGSLRELEAAAEWRPNATFGALASVEHVIARLPEGEFTETVAGLRLRVNLSPNLEARSFVQYDTESREVGTNTRIRWTIRPTAELFVVYNHNLRNRFDRLRFESNQLLAKFVYAFTR